MDRFVISEEPADSDDVRWCFEQYYAGAGAAGRAVTRLETNEQLGAALTLYRKRGYVEVEPARERSGDTAS